MVVRWNSHNETKKYRLMSNIFEVLTSLTSCIGLIHGVIYRVIQNKGPPYGADLRNVPWKLKIAFSNTIYSKTIWRVTCCATDYLPMNESLCKMSSIYFWLFERFAVSSPTSLGSTKEIEKQPNWIPLEICYHFAFLSLVLMWNHRFQLILPFLRLFWGHFGEKMGRNWFFLIFPKNGSGVSAEYP